MVGRRVGCFQLLLIVRLLRVRREGPVQALLPLLWARAWEWSRGVMTRAHG